MMEDLFGRAPYSNETTSKEAAASIEPYLSNLEATVHGSLVRQGPAACFEIEQRTGLAHTTVSARLRGLFLKNRIADSGERRKTPSGRAAIVWTAT